jgi:hypothetical protein
MLDALVNVVDRLLGIEHRPSGGLHRVFDPENRLFSLLFKRWKL